MPERYDDTLKVAANLKPAIATGAWVVATIDQATGRTFPCYCCGKFGCSLSLYYDWKSTPTSGKTWKAEAFIGQGEFVNLGPACFTKLRKILGITPAQVREKTVE